MIEQDIISLFNWQDIWLKIREKRQQVIADHKNNNGEKPDSNNFGNNENAEKLKSHKEFEFPVSLANYLVSQPENPIPPSEFVRDAIMLGLVLEGKKGIFQNISGEESEFNFDDVTPFPSDSPLGQDRSDFSLDKDTAVKIRAYATKNGFKQTVQQWIYKSIALLRMLGGLDLQMKVWGKPYPFNMEYVRNYFEAHEWPIPEITPMSNHMTLKAESSNRA